LVPVPAPKPVDPPAPYTGIYRDINGNPDPLGQYQEYNWRGAHDQAVGNVTPKEGGLFEISEISQWDGDTTKWTDEIRDTDVLWQSANKEPRVFFRVLKGSPLDINRVINASEMHWLWLVHRNPDYSKYNGKLKGIVNL
jgi:hypothetical protein